MWAAQVFPELDADGIDLLRRLLQYDANQRITAAEALRHPWLAGAALEIPEQAANGLAAQDDRASPLSDETQLRNVPDGAQLSVGEGCLQHQVCLAVHMLDT